MDPSTVEVKHDAKVNGYAAQNRKAVDESPVGGLQRDLPNRRWSRSQQVVQIKHSSSLPCIFSFLVEMYSLHLNCPKYCEQYQDLLAGKLT